MTCANYFTSINETIPFCLNLGNNLLLLSLYHVEQQQSLHTLFQNGSQFFYSFVCMLISLLCLLLLYKIKKLFWSENEPKRTHYYRNKRTANGPPFLIWYMAFSDGPFFMFLFLTRGGPWGNFLEHEITFRLHCAFFIRGQNLVQLSDMFIGRDLKLCAASLHK